MWSGLADTITKLWRGRRMGRTGCQQQSVNGCLSNTASCDEHVAEPSAEQVRAFLRTHPDFLERFIMEEVELEQLERWMIRSTQRSKKRPDAPGTGKNGRKTSLSRWKFCVHADKRQMLQELTKSLQQKPTKAHVLWELAGCICSAIGAEGYRLYLAERGDPEMLGLYLGQDGRLENGEAVIEKVGPGLTVPVYVARTREPLRMSRGDVDPRFPDSLPNKNETSHALYQPVVQTDGQLAAVVELWRRDPFHEEDEEIASSYLVWGGIALHYAQLYLSMNKQRKLNDFLLAVVKSIFQDMVSMDTLIMKIMNFAQRLVDADRASLFLVDNKNKELFARIFDIGITSDDVGSSSTGGGDSGGEESISKLPPSTEIRFPLGTGIAGQVANTGEVLNIPDAYCDPRFNRTIDQLTGYRTKSILCMPIFIRGSIIGVVQMVNKRSGDFVKEDEEAFEMFAVYCGLALHHAKLYDKIARSEQKYRVALEVLSYHNTCSEGEVTRAIDEPIPDCIPGVENYYFSVFKLDDFEKAIHAIYMFKDLFGLSRFDTESLIRFTLTVRKNYRRVPYHNWTHGFSVANSMYSVIKHSQNVFKPNECLALYIASLCHDLDHRGKNNKFMLDTESPLAAIYSTSTMEHHHFNQTVTILQQKGHNIFSKLNSWEYKQVLSYVKHCILATDLALFFPNKAKLAQLVAEQSFSWGDLEHRLLILAISMTACDLSASAKPWEVQVKTVKVIFEEFYEQGDAEKLAGHVPSPLMDRDRKCELGAIQVGFLTGICIPCYSLLYKLIPETKPMLDQCQANLERWKQIDEETKRQKDAGGVDALTFLDKVLESSEKAGEDSTKKEAKKCEDVPEVHREEKSALGDTETTEENQKTAGKDSTEEAITVEEGKDSGNKRIGRGEESDVVEETSVVKKQNGVSEEYNTKAEEKKEEVTLEEANDVKDQNGVDEENNTKAEEKKEEITLEEHSDVKEQNGVDEENNTKAEEKKEEMTLGEPSDVKEQNGVDEESITKAEERKEEMTLEERNQENENKQEEANVDGNGDQKGADAIDENVDVSVIIQQLTDEDSDVEMRGTIRVDDARIVHHKGSPLET